ncbi:MAG: nucleoside hydrolase [Alphaproteobacteria bacterium]
MAALPIIFDCDPGVDDAVALMMALAVPERLDVRAITPVAGNVGLERTALNARALRELCGRPEVPVHAGCPRPLVGPVADASHVHGASGLGNLVLPPPKQPLDDGHAVSVIVHMLRQADPGEITLCPVGPLTNIAQAMVMAPDIVPRIARIVLMGGATSLGNVTPSAEFNIYADAEAARIVFEAGAPIVMFGLDVTMQVIASPARMAATHALKGPVADAVRALELSRPAAVERFGTAGVALHDACVIAWLLQPELFSGREVHVDVETRGEFTRGRTVVDWWGRQKDRAPNALVMDRADADGFFALLADCIARYG